MKENELRELTTCCVCKHKLGETDSPMFYTINVESFILDMKAIQRQQGLAMQLDGNGLIASVMGPNEDMAKLISSFPKVMICQACAMSNDLMLIAIE